jgi:NADPH2:quinone reductase
MGFNFVGREVGERITNEVIDLVRAGKVKPVIGQVVGFDDVPQAIDDLANRRTTGRVVIQLAD